VKYLVKVSTNIHCDRRIEVRARNEKFAKIKARRIANGEADFMHAWNFEFPSWFDYTEEIIEKEE